MRKDGEGDGNEKDQHDETASASTARTAAAKAKSPLEPGKHTVQKEEFKQTSQTTLTITHGNLLNSKF
jgi:hypothetical protein